jgi:WhiB family redox-sensing transcriptional regulator
MTVDAHEASHSEYPNDLKWQELASCRGLDPALFYPEDNAGTWQAKKVCAACCVREECLEYALDHKESYGVRGGFSEGGRRKLLKLRRLAALERQAGSVALDPSPETNV